MTVLELAEIGETDLALATLRLLSEAEYEQRESRENGTAAFEENTLLNRKSSIEMRVINLEKMRMSGAKGGLAVQSASTKDLLPRDYYGEDNVSKQVIRERIGDQLSDAVPVAVRGRLVALLQQAIKWQSHTAQLPMVYVGDDYDDPTSTLDNSEHEEQHRAKKKKKNTRNYRIDIVMGDVPLPVSSSSGSGGRDSKRLTVDNTPILTEKMIPSKECGKIKFGKTTSPECAVFLPDGQGFVTGSSDGFVEVWETRKWGKLRTHDLPYQKKDEFMMHKTAVLSIAHSTDGEMLATGSADGTVKVWRLATGICLREFEGAHSKGVLCLCFRKDGSHVLTGSQDYLCREFGLRTSRMLKEFRAHSSYVNTCCYLYDEISAGDISKKKMLIATGSADGSVIIWDGSSAEVLYIIRPSGAAVVPGSNLTTSLPPEILGEAIEGQNIHTVIALHSMPQMLIVIPRGPKAFLLTFTGMVHRIYERNDVPAVNDSLIIVAATVSPSNKILFCATQDGACICFDVESGKSVASFGLEAEAEITGLVHHPHLSQIASFSSHSSARGLIKIWG